MTKQHHGGGLLSRSETTVLDCVIRHGPIRQRDIVEMTRCDAATVSAAVRQLRAGGWVTGSGRAPVEVRPGAVARATQAALQPPLTPRQVRERARWHARVSPVGGP